MATARGAAQKLLAQLNRCQDREIPNLLLRIPDILEEFRSEALDVRLALWNLDILQTLVDILQYDFPSFYNKEWSVAVSLVDCLVKSCVGLPYNNSDCLEFLYVVIDRVLQVAFTIKGAASYKLTDFKATIQSLYMLIEDKPELSSAILNNRLFLQLLMMEGNESGDSAQEEHLMLRLLRLSLSLLDNDELLAEDTAMLCYDELLYQLYNCHPSDTKTPQLTADILFEAAKQHNSFKSLLLAPGTDSAQEILEEIVVSKTSHSSINVLLRYIRMCREEEKKKAKLNAAATRIQRVYRGYHDRKTLQEQNAKIAKFQVRFRKYLRDKAARKELERRELARTEREDELRFNEKREYLTREAAVLSSLPAKSIPHYLFKVRSSAASTIQAAWRRKAAQVKVDGMRKQRKENLAATTIQTAYRKYRNPGDARNVLPDGLTPARIRELRDRVREMLAVDQTESETNSEPTNRIPDKELFSHSQQMYQRYSKLHDRTQRADKHRHEICSKMSDQMILLCNAPALRNSSPDDVQKYMMFCNNTEGIRDMRAVHRSCMANPSEYHRLMKQRENENDRVPLDLNIKYADVTYKIRSLTTT